MHALLTCYLHSMPPEVVRRSAKNIQSKDEGIKWQDLLVHFKSVQAKHEKSRKQGLKSLIDKADCLRLWQLIMFFF
jgi:hypothetical protein